MTPEQFEATCNLDAYDEGGYRRIGQDVIIIDGEPCNVSTIWMGIDLGMSRGGPPIIFETMVFGGPHDYACMRYATELDAREGHARTVADLAAGQAPWFLRDDDVDVMWGFS